ncbi:hypothetical protein MES4922_120133 [Mesorhizobium ventifaucium]|uniref:Uncharacterized protein n=1 Tax=Mesorhizobium ventifaucium TaxID=666020 RepID=A0ABM9DFN1_9HYPH|nr:hypothetical protein MES4922_120133 [Mesorhizobium ventifaucium]
MSPTRSSRKVPTKSVCSTKASGRGRPFCWWMPVPERAAQFSRVSLATVRPDSFSNSGLAYTTRSSAVRSATAMAIGTWSRNFLNSSLSSAVARSGVSSNCSTASACSELDVICAPVRAYNNNNAVRPPSPKLELASRGVRASDQKMCVARRPQGYDTFRSAPSGTEVHAMAEHVSQFEGQFEARSRNQIRSARGRIWPSGQQKARRRLRRPT